MNFRRKSSAFAKWIASLFAEETVTKYVIPFAISIGASVMGWLEDVPWFYLAVGVLLLFAAVSTGLSRFDEWRYRILPIAIIIVLGVLGWHQDTPWFHLIVGVGVLFVAIPTGLLRFDEWRYRNSVEGKLVFNNMRIHKTLSEDGTVGTVSLGFLLHNRATFPIQFEVAELNTSLMNLFPPKKEYTNKIISIPANFYGWFDDYDIEIQNNIKNQKIEGSLKSHLKYGRPDRLNHEIKLEKRVIISFDHKGDIMNAHWHDL